MTTWVLLRGLTRERRHWGGFPELFRERLGAGAVVTPDLPGNGRLHHLPSPLRVDGMVDYLRGELRRQGHVPPYSLLALSLGGMVATAWAATYPEELRAAVLVNTSLRPFGRFYQRLRPAAYPALGGVLLAGGDAARRERLVWRLTSNRAAPEAGLLDAWSAWRRECPVATGNVLRQLLAAARCRAPARPPPLPVLLLASAGDRLVDCACSRRLAAAWGAPLAVHPTAGHDLPLDDGPWVVQQVLDWLRAPVPPAATVS